MHLPMHHWKLIADWRRDELFTVLSVFNKDTQIIADWRRDELFTVHSVFNKDTQIMHMWLRNHILRNLEFNIQTVWMPEIMHTSRALLKHRLFIGMYGSSDSPHYNKMKFTVPCVPSILV